MKSNEITDIKTMSEYNIRGVFTMEQQFVVGWGTLALINAGLAQGKNRSGLNWFLLSLLLGPIATLLIVTFEKL